MSPLLVPLLCVDKGGCRLQNFVQPPVSCKQMDFKFSYKGRRKKNILVVEWSINWGGGVNPMSSTKICFFSFRTKVFILLSKTYILDHSGSYDTTLFLILYRKQVVEGVTECTLDSGELGGELPASCTVLRIMLYVGGGGSEQCGLVCN